MGVETYAADKGEWSGSDPEDAKRLIERIRHRFQYMMRAWKDIRDQAELDQRALSTTGPWTDAEIEQRKDKRPCIHLDQLSQHIAFLINNVKSNPIAIKVEPAGEGSDENTAELRGKRIRAIEYESNAVQAYQTALESAASMSFGVFGITIAYKSWDSNQRVIKIRRFPNAHAVLWDPDCQEIDCCDMKDAFVLYRMSKEDVARDYPDWGTNSFGEELQRIGWEDNESIQVAEYWYIKKKRRRMFHLETRDGIQRLFADEMMNGWKAKDGFFTFLNGEQARILDDRITHQPIVKMCITNGVDVDEETDWPGKEIPIIPIIGKERYVKVGNSVKRQIDSYIRMARDGQKLFDYYASNEAEVIGMTPKIPYIGYKGQFTEDYWASIHKDPRAYAEVEPIVDPMTNQVLPLPMRQAYEPPVQALEVGKESTRRSIQAAVASYGVTRLDDTNVKSGIALEKIQSQNDLGSYHFIDNYKIAIRRAARIVNDLLDDVESGQIDVALRGYDDTQEVVKLNQQGPDGQMNQYRLTDEGQHEVTLSTGPSYQSQREEGTAFADTLVANIKNLPIDPQTAMKLLAQSIKLKNLGPIGDKIEEILDPQDAQGSPEQAVQQLTAQLQQSMQQLQALNEYAKQLEAQIQQANMEKEANAQDNAVKLQITELQEETKRILKLAELQSKEGIAELQARIDAIQAQLEASQAERAQDHAESQAEIQADQSQQQIDQAGQQQTQK